MKTILRVKDVMKTTCCTIDGTATIHEALLAMRDNKTSVLVVNKRHVDDEFGMITSTDIARHVLSKDRSPLRVNVYEIMACPVITVSPDMEIKLCSRLFDRYNLVRAPVIDRNGKLVGTISPNALVLQGLYQIYC
ncbi:CBS domain-containing protein [methane-oxidizing endosymbiont of Gigantopelta aegis]|uniref:CBS domain-containing protein n=1 Tax=methane-oxidizing endosymbiont of Gigantopelta aegis TaxID=2794938 RepID=UPI0018DD2AF7|nr:CBS domain-containing protein [methane-oxidizing endosymbiont of Gigantopelta aegis]